MVCAGVALFPAGDPHRNGRPHIMRLQKLIPLLSTLLLSDAPADESASAAVAAPIQLEPVRVTADLWETPLDRIAASVSVYGPETLEGGAVRHFGDLADQIPNLTYTGGTSRPRYFQIRGVGENSQFEGETPDSTVRFLVDDLDFTGLGTVGSTFDVRQVEVLRGPQAGAFGANAAGGVVRLVTNEPGPVWSGDISAATGEDGLREVGVAAGGPLAKGDSEKLQVRVAAQRSESDGFRRNAFLNADSNARDESMARVKLIWRPCTFWRWDATAFFADADNGFDEFALDNNGRFTFSDEPGRDEQRSRAATLRGVYSGWSGVRLTTVTTAAWTDSTYSYDSDWTSVYTHPDAYKGFAAITRERGTLGQELRLDSVDADDAAGWIDRWTLGAYFSRLDEASAFATDRVRSTRSDYRADNFALFGQAAHDFTVRTRIILGLRAEYVDQQSAVDKDASGTVDFRPAFADTLTGGKLTLEHDLSPRQAVFASAARGYKTGGVSVDANINPTSDPLRFGTETLWNFEAGLRSRWLGDCLLGEVTAFHVEREDVQLRGSVGDKDAFRYYTTNGGAARGDGLESALTWRLADAWSVFGTLALLRTERESFTLPNGASAKGRELAATPGYGYTVGLRRRVATGWFGDFVFAGRDRYYESESSDETRAAYVVANASLGHAWREWSLTLWGRNLLDAEYDKRVFFFGNDPVSGYAPTRYVSRADPRQFGVSAQYRF
jgi:outer membrane receptor protein involved in Fe transport